MMNIEAPVTPSKSIEDRLLACVGDLDKFARNWSWRSHSPKQRAVDALRSAEEDISDAISSLAAQGATPDQIEAWATKAINMWLAYQAAGARTANPMITGPANFPAARNQKAMTAERKRGEEYYAFAHRPIAWLNSQTRRSEKAALSAEAATVDHRALEFPGVKLVQNTTLNRIQLLFDGKPEADTIKALKGEAFRWSPRESAWQRQNTNNGVQAAYRVLRALGHEKGSLTTPTRLNAQGADRGR